MTYRAKVAIEPFTKYKISGISAEIPKAISGRFVLQ
jgi:hypothetical protein